MIGPYPRTIELISYLRMNRDQLRVAIAELPADNQDNMDHDMDDMDHDMAQGYEASSAAVNELHCKSFTLIKLAIAYLGELDVIANLGELDVLND